MDLCEIRDPGSFGAVALSLYSISSPPELMAFMYLDRSTSRYCVYVLLLRQGNLGFPGGLWGERECEEIFLRKLETCGRQFREGCVAERKK